MQPLPMPTKQRIHHSCRNTNDVLHPPRSSLLQRIIILQFLLQTLSFFGSCENFKSNRGLIRVETALPIRTTATLIADNDNGYNIYLEGTPKSVAAMRGGSSGTTTGDSSKESGNSDKNDAANEDDSADKNQNQTKAFENGTGKTQQRRSIVSPFEFNEMAKEEASAVIDETSAIENEDDENGQSTSDLPEVSSTTGDVLAENDKSRRDEEAGATSKNKKAKSKRSPNAAENSKRASPFSLRLLDNNNVDDNDDVDNGADEEENDNEKRDVQDEGADVSSRGSISDSAGANMNRTDIAKLWWVNMFTQLTLSEVEQDDTSASDADDDTVGGDTDDGGSDVDGTEKQDALAESAAGVHSMKQKKGGGKKQQDQQQIQARTNESKAKKAASSQNEKHGKEGGAESVETPKSEIRPEDEGVSVLDTSAVPEKHAYVSSGLWVPVDNILTFGLASRYRSLRISRRLRRVRKLSARITGMHGMLSGKPRRKNVTSAGDEKEEVERNLSDEGEDGKKVDAEDEIQIRRRIAAIDKARENVKGALEAQGRESGAGFFGMRRNNNRNKPETEDMGEIDGEGGGQAETPDAEPVVEKGQREPQPQEEQRRRLEIEERKRLERVQEIDRLIAQGQERLQELVCEKDVLQRRPNPLFNYTSSASEADATVFDDVEDGSGKPSQVQASRTFSFPPDDLVEEYLEMIFSNQRVIKMNHTFLWQDTDSLDDDDDESIGDDLLNPSVDAHKLYRNTDYVPGLNERQGKKLNGGGGGSWLLRQSIGKGPTLGEKIGEAAETAAYKAVCGAVMSFLARSLSSLHGINVMKHSDIRLVLEQSPDLPPVGEGVIPGGSQNYAQDAIQTVIKKKIRKGRKRSKLRPVEDSFVQRDAVTEMLLSHVQISAPLLKLFPLMWQRAFLGNILTLATSVMSDFFEGLQFQILGHQLCFSFKPITEEDMIYHFGLAGGGVNRRLKPEEFEAAVRATAADVGEELKFLDRWHERLLGGGVLRTQIANLIARIVLTLTDEVLSGASMNLWSAHAGGPRLLACLEYRT